MLIILRPNTVKLSMKWYFQIHEEMQLCGRIDKGYVPNLSSMTDLINIWLSQNSSRSHRRLFLIDIGDSAIMVKAIVPLLERGARGGNTEHSLSWLKKLYTICVRTHMVHKGAISSNFHIHRPSCKEGVLKKCILYLFLSHTKNRIYTAHFENFVAQMLS